jgi:hypothetical protein
VISRGGIKRGARKRAVDNQTQPWSTVGVNDLFASHQRVMFRLSPNKGENKSEQNQQSGGNGLHLSGETNECTPWVVVQPL